MIIYGMKLSRSPFVDNFCVADYSEVIAQWLELECDLIDEVLYLHSLSPQSMKLARNFNPTQ